MAKTVIKVGLVVAGIFPSIFIVLVGLSALMPGCSLGGSGGPAFGCKLLGISFDWLIGWATPAFVISFFTVPIGLLTFLIGACLPGKSSR
jgi:hypothetical protein